MPAFLEKILKKRYGANSDIPYRIMNAQGYMRGPKETAKGKRLQQKHDADIRAEKAK
jgi:hypothetical protein